jgi:hypothetical protein
MRSKLCKGLLLALSRTPSSRLTNKCRAHVVPVEDLMGQGAVDESAEAAAEDNTEAPGIENHCRSSHHNHKTTGLTSGNHSRADEGNRTPNLLITNQLLYQLSYVSGMHERRFARRKESSSSHQLTDQLARLIRTTSTEPSGLSRTSQPAALNNSRIRSASA